MDCNEFQDAVLIKNNGQCLKCRALFRNENAVLFYAKRIVPSEGNLLGLVESERTYEILTVESDSKTPLQFHLIVIDYKKQTKITNIINTTNITNTTNINELTLHDDSRAYINSVDNSGRKCFLPLAKPQKEELDKSTPEVHYKIARSLPKIYYSQSFAKSLQNMTKSASLSILQQIHETLIRRDNNMCKIKTIGNRATYSLRLHDGYSAYCLRDSDDSIVIHYLHQRA